MYSAKQVLIQPAITELHLVLETPNGSSYTVSLKSKETPAIFVRIWNDLTTDSGHYFAKLKNCTRCPMPNVNPMTANVETQPNMALAKTRTTPEGILFGVNAGLYRMSETAYIEVGHRLQVEFEF